MKYYFEYPDSEICYTKEHFIEMMRENEVTEMKVYPAQIEYGTDYFWCSEYGGIGETRESCGRLCDKYKPRNGKNGRCIYHNNCHVPIDKPIILKLKQ